ncbi:MAG TPA: hypothetical protein VFN30_02565 [Chitinophagaceae bacterium]|nr:hypothetical protein [Chitinophagaceae bacterium]
MDTLDKNRERRHQQYNKMRSWLDYAMGSIILAVGLLIFLGNYIGIVVGFPDPIMTKIFGGLCLLYGGWRIYRGAKQPKA